LNYLIQALNLFIILIAALSWSSVVHAQKLATCEMFKEEPTEIEVHLVQEKPMDVRDYDFSELQTYKKQGLYKWKHPDETLSWVSDMDDPIGGFYRASVGVDVGFGFTVAPYEGQLDLSCVFVDYLKIYIHYGGTIFLDKTFDDVECRDVGVLAHDHLKGRYDIGAGITISTQAMLKQELPDVIKAMERLAVKTEKAQDKVDNIKKSLKAGGRSSAQDIVNEIISLNNAVEIPEDIIVRRQQCIKSIPPQYRP